MTVGRVAFGRKILDLDDVSEATALTDTFPPDRVSVVLRCGKSETLTGPTAQAVWLRLLDGAANLTPSEPVPAEPPTATAPASTTETNAA